MSSLLMHVFRPGQVSPDWEFQDPDSGVKFSATSRAALVKTILQYRANNGLEPIPNLDLAIENYLCSLPVNCGKCKAVTTLKRGVVSYVKGGISLFKSMLYDKFATQSEADARSEVCSTCPNNVFPDKTFFVKWSDEVALASVGKRKSNNHSKLGNCEVCSCPLRAKVWIHKDNLTAEPEHMEKFPDPCWVKKELTVG